MNNPTYDTIKSSMPDSLRMKLDHIKRYLDAGKPKSLLKGQELTLDNHHPNTPLVWDEHLYIHKRVTLKNQGKNVAVSGSLYVGKNREVVLG